MSGSRLTTEQRHLDVQLPQTGIDFSITDVIGRCVAPCSCPTPQTGDKVCGADGRSYESECYAECAGVQVSDKLCCFKQTFTLALAPIHKLIILLVLIGLCSFTIL